MGLTMNAEIPAGDEFDEQYVTLKYDKLKRLAYNVLFALWFRIN